MCSRRTVAGPRALGIAATVRGHPAAAQRDRGPACWSCPDGRPRGRHGASGAHDRPRDAVAAGARPCVDRGAGGARPDPGRRKGSPARAWVASATWSACGSSWTRPATSSPSSIAVWASRPTGAASASPWTPASAHAVRTAFKRLYDDGLAYRDEQLINWCPGCQTSLSDLEVAATPQTGTIWSVRYHLARADGSPDPDADHHGRHDPTRDDRGRHRGGGASGRPAIPGPGR